MIGKSRSPDYSTLPVLPPLAKSPTTHDVPKPLASHALLPGHAGGALSPGASGGSMHKMRPAPLSLDRDTRPAGAFPRPLGSPKQPDGLESPTGDGQENESMLHLHEPSPSLPTHLGAMKSLPYNPHYITELDTIMPGCQIALPDVIATTPGFMAFIAVHSAFVYTVAEGVTPRFTLHRVLTVAGGTLAAVAIDEASGRIALAATDKRIHIFDLQTGDPVRDIVLELPLFPISIKYHRLIPDTLYVLFYSRSAVGELRLINTVSGRSNSIASSLDEPMLVTSSPHNKEVAVAFASGEVRLFGLTGDGTGIVYARNLVDGTFVSSDPDLMARAQQANKPAFSSATSKENVRELQKVINDCLDNGKHCNALAAEYDPLNPDHLVVAWHFGAHALFNVATGECLVVYENIQGGVSGVSFLADQPGCFLTTDSQDIGMLRLWTVSSKEELWGRRLGVLPFQQCVPLALAARSSKNGKDRRAAREKKALVALLDKQGGICVYSLADRRIVYQTLQGHTEAIYTVAYDPANPRVFLSGGSDGYVKQWSARFADNLNSPAMPYFYAPSAAGAATAPATTGPGSEPDLVGRKTVLRYARNIIASDPTANMFKIRDPRAGPLNHLVRYPSVFDVRYSPCPGLPLILVSYANGFVRLFSKHSGRLVCNLLNASEHFSGTLAVPKKDCFFSQYDLNFVANMFSGTLHIPSCICSAWGGFGTAPLPSRDMDRRGRLIATGWSDGCVRVCMSIVDTQSARQISGDVANTLAVGGSIGGNALRGQQGPASGAEFSLDGLPAESRAELIGSSFRHVCTLSLAEMLGSPTNEEFEIVGCEFLPRSNTLMATLTRGLVFFFDMSVCFEQSVEGLYRETYMGDKEPIGRGPPKDDGLTYKRLRPLFDLMHDKLCAAGGYFILSLPVLLQLSAGVASPRRVAPDGSALDGRRGRNRSFGASGVAGPASPKAVGNADAPSDMPYTPVQFCTPERLRALLTTPPSHVFSSMSHSTRPHIALTDKKGCVYVIAYSEDLLQGRLAAAGFRLLATYRGLEADPLTPRARASAAKLVYFLPEAQDYYLCCGQGGVVHLVNYTTGSLVAQMRSGKTLVYSIDVHPAQPFCCICVSKDGAIRQLDLLTCGLGMSLLSYVSIKYAALCCGTAGMTDTVGGSAQAASADGFMRLLLGRDQFLPGSVSRQARDALARTSRRLRHLASDGDPKASDALEALLPFFYSANAHVAEYLRILFDEYTEADASCAYDVDRLYYRSQLVMLCLAHEVLRECQVRAPDSLRDRIVGAHRLLEDLGTDGGRDGDGTPETPEAPEASSTTAVADDVIDAYYARLRDYIGGCYSIYYLGRDVSPGVGAAVSLTTILVGQKLAHTITLMILLNELAVLSDVLWALGLVGECVRVCALSDRKDLWLARLRLFAADAAERAGFALCSAGAGVSAAPSTLQQQNLGRFNLECAIPADFDDMLQHAGSERLARYLLDSRRPAEAKVALSCLKNASEDSGDALQPLLRLATARLAQRYCAEKQGMCAVCELLTGREYVQALRLLLFSGNVIPAVILLAALSSADSAVDDTESMRGCNTLAADAVQACGLPAEKTVYRNLLTSLCLELYFTFVSGTAVDAETAASDAAARQSVVPPAELSLVPEASSLLLSCIMQMADAPQSPADATGLFLPPEVSVSELFRLFCGTFDEVLANAGELLGTGSDQSVVDALKDSSFGLVFSGPEKNCNFLALCNYLRRCIWNEVHFGTPALTSEEYHALTTPTAGGCEKQLRNSLEDRGSSTEAALTAIGRIEGKLGQTHDPADTATASGSESENVSGGGEDDMEALTSLPLDDHESDDAMDMHLLASNGGTPPKLPEPLPAQQELVMIHREPAADESSSRCGEAEDGDTVPSEDEPALDPGEQEPDSGSASNDNMPRGHHDQSTPHDDKSESGHKSEPSSLRESVDEEQHRERNTNGITLDNAPVYAGPAEDAENCACFTKRLLNTISLDTRVTPMDTSAQSMDVTRSSAILLERVVNAVRLQGTEWVEASPYISYLVKHILLTNIQTTISPVEWPLLQRAFIAGAGCSWRAEQLHACKTLLLSSDRSARKFKLTADAAAGECLALLASSDALAPLRNRHWKYGIVYEGRSFFDNPNDRFFTLYGVVDRFMKWANGVFC